MVQAHGITLKKKHGQHFLRDAGVVADMIKQVALDPTCSVFEIGCGDGFLTSAIMQQPIARLWVFEIDHEWAEYVRSTITDKRLTVYETNFLDTDLSILAPDAPWIVLANLPYNVTFPILRRFHQYRQFLKEGVVMMQEEVAQKIVKTQGRGYGYPSLFFNYYFEWRLLNKIPPSVFHPAPKVFSRLLYFKPRAHVVPIEHEEEFWKFIKICFKQPRRTFRNNLAQSHYEASRLSQEQLALRAQQMSMDDLLQIWRQLNV